MKKVFYFIICALAFAVGCNFNDLDVNNLEGPTITSNSGLPIGNITYTMRELLEEVSDPNIELTEDSTSLVSISYSDTITYSSDGDIIDISNVSVPSVSIQIPAAPAIGSVTTETISDIFQLAYKPAENERVDSIFYSQGDLVFTFSVSPDAGYITSYTATVIETKNINSDDPIVFTESSPTSASLIDHKTNFIFQGDSSVFELELEYTLEIPAGEAFPETEIEVGLAFIDADFDIIYGRFGQDTVSFQTDVLDLDFFDDLGESGFLFGNPKLKFTYESNVGLPIGILYGGIYGVEGTEPNTDTTYMAGDVTETPQELNIPETPGDFVITEDSIFNQNSSIVSFLSTTPNQLGFDLMAIANPFDADQSNFLVPNTEITAYIEADLPLEIQLNDVSRDLDFSLGGGLSFDEADSLTLRVVSTNEIPFSVLLDLEVYDENDSLTFVAAENLVIETPFLNVDGSLKQPRKQISDIPIGEEGILALNEGSRINLKVTLNTPESRNSDDIFVKILADATLDIQLSVVGTLKVDL